MYGRDVLISGIKVPLLEKSSLQRCTEIMEKMYGRDVALMYTSHPVTFPCFAVHLSHDSAPESSLRYWCRCAFFDPTLLARLPADDLAGSNAPEILLLLFHSLHILKMCKE